MIQRHLVHHLKRVEKRIRRYRLLRDSAFCWFIAAGIGFGLLSITLTGFSPTSAALWVVLGSMVTSAGLLLWNRFRNISPKAVAHTIEQQHPDLKERLLTAVEQQSAQDNNLSGGIGQTNIQSLELVPKRRNPGSLP